MSLRITTAIVEPNMLIREGLTSLLEKYSYRVVGSANEAAEFGNKGFSEAPKLVLVGAETMEQALADAETCRKLWPASKIMLLMGPADTNDFRQMMASEIDGCVPLSVARDTLMRTIDLMMLEDAKILVMLGPSHTRIQPLVDQPQPQDSRVRQHNGGNHGDDLGKISIMHTASPALACISNSDPVADAGPQMSQRRNMHRLSEREAQILDGIVCGYSNKMIARTCGITEATVKVHMKSILRKIHVANRTQAAVWAMENNYTVRMEKRLVEIDTDGAAA
ncbi:MAG TPA: response regulator transcription factor [Pseudolabrys sp.]|nr:response regulator transcription factor [Pseudolabrys sp.]